MKKFSIFYWVSLFLAAAGLVLLSLKLFLFFYLCLVGYLISISYAGYCLAKDRKYQNVLYNLLKRDRGLAFQAMLLTFGKEEVSDINEFKSQIHSLLNDVAVLYKAKKITQADYEGKFASSVSFWKKFIGSRLSEST